jgi:hypothetical protein
MALSPDFNRYPAGDRSEFPLYKERILDQGLDPFAGELMLHVLRASAVAFIEDGQPLDVTVNGVSGIESPDSQSVIRESATRFHVEAEFIARQSEEAIEAGIMPDGLPTFHGLRIVIPKVRAWRKNNPPEATVFIDTFFKPAVTESIKEVIDEM